MKLYIKEENLTNNELIKIYDENLELVYVANKNETELEIADKNNIILASVVSKDAKWLNQADIYYDDALVASVKREYSSFVEKRYVEPLNYEIRGDIKNHTIQIYKGKDIVVSYEKKWLTYQSAYELSIDKSEDPLLVVAIILSLEMSC